MTDIFGPADAAGALVARPVDGRAFPAGDTWFGDCSSPNAADGTDIEAAWLNSIIANLRAVVRTSGVVTEDNSDLMLLRGVQHLIQSAGPIYTATAGTASAYTATLAPAPPTYAAVRSVIIVPHVSNTGAATINFNGLGALPLTFGGVTALPAGILLAGVPTTIMISGGAAHIGGGRGGRVVMRWLTASTTWIAPDGCWSVGYGIWAGGAGGGGVASSGGAASGGGAGGFVPGIADVVPGQAVPVTVGAGGAYGNASGGTSSDGGNGGATSFGSFATAYGGTGGKAASGSFGAPVAGGGGVGGIGVIPGRSAGGGMSVRDSAGSGIRYIGSPGGSAFGGAPIGQITGTTGAHDAGFPGGGGGGAGSNSTAIIGAPGAPGLVWLWEMYG
ncbi:hypothetical protein SAMN02745172_02453 [Pseudoxanthobacter soli DSM 19599]|uniref:Glycine-rich domain-containing protein n=1 Tax=Pseudoxanthobacter soli DSM 19599 TaxID=1123029 RepID=A0A1M7ZMC5_9HYPH|nr:hypothetical protein [Pseudoxanthobacter soli]SHO65806.1 hypothetical protein SAMN02745172_02453 [Pseudoxanthobacter soli DSM 19599]